MTITMMYIIYGIQVSADTVKKLIGFQEKCRKELTDKPYLAECESLVDFEDDFWCQMQYSLDPFDYEGVQFVIRVRHHDQDPDEGLVIGLELAQITCDSWGAPPPRTFPLPTEEDTDKLKLLRTHPLLQDLPIELCVVTNDCGCCT